LSDAQARDHDTTARMGFDRHGRIVAMQIDTLAALGAYLSNFAPSIPGNSYPQTVTGLYKTPNLHLRVRGIYTNTVPVDAYLGSGPPEASQRAPRRVGRAPARYRRGRDAPAQSHHAGRISLFCAGGTRLRLRRSAGAAATALDARRLSRAPARTGEAAREG